MPACDVDPEQGSWSAGMKARLVVIEEALAPLIAGA